MTASNKEGTASIELQAILEAKISTHDLASAILEELRLLEEDIALRNECIRRLVGRIKGD